MAICTHYRTHTKTKFDTATALIVEVISTNCIGRLTINRSNSRSVDKYKASLSYTFYAMASESSEDSVNEKIETTSISNSSPFLTVHIIGGQGGGSFSFLGGSNGGMMNKIGVWVGGWQIKSVKIWLTNGLSRQFGNPSGPYKEFSFQPGELIQSMSLWGNGAGTRLGAIKFKTNKGNEFFAKMTDWGLKQEYPIDVGSGACVGVMGRSGSDIDSMGFQFVKPLKDSRMIDVHYPTIGSEQANVNMNNLKSVNYNNPLDVEQTFSLEVTDTITKKQYWSVTAGLEFAYNVSVTAGIPEVASTTTGWGFKVSVSGTYGMENTETKEEKWTFPIKVPAKSKVHVTISMGKADIDLPYTGKIVMTTTDDSQLTFDVNGAYTGVSYTDVIVDIKKQ